MNVLIISQVLLTSLREPCDALLRQWIGEWRLVYLFALFAERERARRVRQHDYRGPVERHFVGEDAGWDMGWRLRCRATLSSNSSTVAACALFDNRYADTMECLGGLSRWVECRGGVFFICDDESMSQVRPATSQLFLRPRQSVNATQQISQQKSLI
jgi:hypothetical protein